MAILTFEERHDLRKAHLCSPSEIYAAQYVHPDSKDVNIIITVFYFS